MSVAPSPSAAADGQASPAAGAAPVAGEAEQAREVCPLCGAPLRHDQDWCLRCGAAARTRLAAPPKWRLLAIALASIVAIALGVLIVALVELAG